jgi:hypothetical protein
MLMIERRMAKRFRALDGALAALSPDSGRVGQIHNISSDGVAFRYIADDDADPPSVNPPRLHLMFAGEGIKLEGIAVRCIADIELPKDPSFAGIPLRQTCLQFVSLTDDQKFGIREFIRRYTSRTH